MITFKNKKIGIWGLGIVGSSVLNFIKNHTNQIQILDKKIHPEITTIIQTPETILTFLKYNDIIIASPGIALHNYKKYEAKFIQELDIFADNYSFQTIAITGTVGKTSIATLLSKSIPDAIAAGNIGYAMLNILPLNPKPKIVILELSSYQLHYAKTFAPSLAILTNFSPNHLDHHKTKLEYFSAKCNIFKHQRNKQNALIPSNLTSKVKKQIKISSQIFQFSLRKPRKEINYPTYFIEKNNIVLNNGINSKIIFNNVKQLPDITFLENWLIIIAALHIQKISFNHLEKMVQTFKPQEHRLEFIQNVQGVDIYNDSKSTVAQSTKKALSKFVGKKIALFLGGMSKGADRSSLIKSLRNKSITVFAFGKESEMLTAMCKEHNVPCHTAETMQQAVKQYKHHQHNFNVLLFSPAGSSFDLFKDYQDRGNQFKDIIKATSEELDCTHLAQ